MNAAFHAMWASRQHGYLHLIYPCVRGCASHTWGKALGCYWGKGTSYFPFFLGISSPFAFSWIGGLIFIKHRRGHTKLFEYGYRECLLPDAHHGGDAYSWSLKSHDGFLNIGTVGSTVLANSNIFYLQLLEGNGHLYLPSNVAEVVKSGTFHPQDGNILSQT